MEATGTKTAWQRARNRARNIARWIGSTRAIRFPLLVLVGAAITFGIAWYVYNDYMTFCRRYAAFPGRCNPISLRTAVGTAMGLAGLLMIVAGPVVNSIYHLLRYGHTWESSRVETAVSNYPLLAGLIYLATAAVLSFA